MKSHGSEEQQADYLPKLASGEIIGTLAHCEGPGGRTVNCRYSDGALSGIIIVFVPALGAFYIPELLGGTDSQLIGNVIERQFKSANDWPFGAALSFLLMYATFGALALRALLGSRRQGLEV